jgi:hypothetical protein
LPFVVDLPARGGTLFDLVRWNAGRREVSLIEVVDAPRAFQKSNASFGEQLISFSVTSDNAEGISATLSFTTSIAESDGWRRSPLHDVHLADLPEPDLILDVGLLNLVQHSERLISESTELPEQE